VAPAPHDDFEGIAKNDHRRNDLAAREDVDIAPKRAAGIADGRRAAIVGAVPGGRFRPGSRLPACVWEGLRRRRML
jgi:hypothetical protein